MLVSAARVFPVPTGALKVSEGVEAAWGPEVVTAGLCRVAPPLPAD